MTAPKEKEKQQIDESFKTEPRSFNNLQQTQSIQLNELVMSSSSNEQRLLQPEREPAAKKTLRAQAATPGADQSAQTPQHNLGNCISCI